MLSYRHAYHAGSSADVLKHFIIERILSYLIQKEKPCFYIDTHAGAGCYRLDTDIANKTAEYKKGIQPILNASNIPEKLQHYTDLVRTCSAQSSSLKYPGSPWFAANILREQDRLALCELHPQDFPILRDAFKKDKRIQTFNEDGFIKSVGLVPPKERRGLTVIDPSYEIKSDYDNVVEHINKLYTRFATGIYALWYPVVDAERITRLEKKVRKLNMKNTVLYELQTHAADTEGMYASGMVVVNSPWTLEDDVRTVLPWLSKTLGDEQGDWRVQQLSEAS